jgi:hypothetical protein
VKLDRSEQVTAEPTPPPQIPREDLLNRNVGRRYDTPRRYDTRVQAERNPERQTRAERD